MTETAAAPDAGTMQLGMLMETAHAHQEVIEGSLKRLQAHTQGLDDVVRDEIRRVFAAELAELVDESARAASALRSLGRAASLRSAGWGALFGAVPGVALSLLLAWWLPTPAQVGALRLEHARLAAGIARLTDSGARIDVRRCGASSRLCVRVDRRAPAYDEQADSLVVRGY
jgi:hypothetical protein